MLLQESNRPYNIDFALYLNGQLVPATAVSVSSNGETVTMTIGLSPLNEIFRIGANDKIHAAFFVKDDIYFKDEPRWVLFWEGEVTGQNFYRDSSSANVSFSVEPINITTMGRIKMKSMFSNQDGILSPTALPMPLTDIIMMMGGFPIGQTNNIQEGQKVDISVKVPYDFISSMFMFFFTHDSDFQTEVLKSFRSAYMAVFFMKHIYDTNLIRKIVPDPSQVPSFYGPLVGQMSLGYLTKAIGAKTDGSVLDVVKAALGAFYHVLRPITLPPLVKLKRITPRIMTEEKSAKYPICKPHYTSQFDEFMKRMSSPEEEPEVRWQEDVIVTESATYDISRLFYDYNGGKEYLAEFVVMPEVPFRAIPRFNLIVSPFCRVVSYNFYYVRPTRGYVYYTLGSSTPNELMITAFPPMAHTIVRNHVLTDRFVSKEEIRRGPICLETLAPDFWVFLTKPASRSLSRWFLLGDKQSEILSQIYGGSVSSEVQISSPESGINKIDVDNVFLTRYAWSSLALSRYGVNRATINLDYPNIYIVAGLPLLFMDPERPNCCFVGDVASVTWNFSSTGSSTSIEVVNVVPIEEYFSEIVYSNLYGHDDFITPAPFFLPILDQAWQTLKGANYNYGMLFFRGKGPAVLDVSDFVGLDVEDEIVKFKYGLDENGQHKSYNILYHPIGVIDSDIYRSFDKYMFFISRPGITLEEYVDLMPYGEISGEYEGRPVNIFNLTEDDAYNYDVNTNLLSYFVKSISNTPERG